VQIMPLVWTPYDLERLLQNKIYIKLKTNSLGWLCPGQWLCPSCVQKCHVQVQNY